MLREIKSADIAEPAKTKIITEFVSCSTGLKDCAKNLEETSAKLDRAEKDFLKLQVIKNRILTALIILSVLVVLTIIIRVLVFVYVRK